MPRLPKRIRKWRCTSPARSEPESRKGSPTRTMQRIAIARVHSSPTEPSNPRPIERQDKPVSAEEGGGFRGVRQEGICYFVSRSEHLCPKKDGREQHVVSE